MPWWCYEHEQHSMDDVCLKCQEKYLLENAAGKLFKACEQARDIIRQVGAIKMSHTIDLIKQRLAKVERACDEAIQLALKGE